ncbi:hypothetical protein QEZ47_15515 [Aminobacter anthyllidis]|uniref:hypothetical protein n=1 Tax=Aminobacter anthyllidis TaxID=1035067 RepID=UPI0024559605|nr:hypothetical protein [Aminobacter anthyllidis]MDH4986914.1 hypothetical protein [Aminobacter anthyllidis]
MPVLRAVDGNIAQAKGKIRTAAIIGRQEAVDRAVGDDPGMDGRQGWKAMKAGEVVRMRDITRLPHAAEVVDSSGAK